MTTETRLVNQLRDFRHACFVSQADTPTVNRKVAEIRSTCERMQGEGWTEQALERIAERELNGFGMPR